MPVASQQAVRAALQEWRCVHCGRILHKHTLAPGSVLEQKCASCNTFNVKQV